MEEIVPGTSRQLSEGDDIAILSIGHVGNFVTEAVEELKKSHVDVAHFDMRFVKPLDKAQLHKIFKKYGQIVTIEDGTKVGGLGSAVLEFMCENDYASKVKILGVPDRFIEHGTQKELWRDCGLLAENIVQTVKAMLKKNVLSKVI